MEAKKLSQARNDLACAIDHRQCQANDAAQGIEAARRIFGVFDLGQDLAGAIEKQRTGIGNRDASRRAQQQRHAEPCLQLADDARHRRLRQAEFAPRARKAAAFRRAHENGQFLQPVAHLCNK